MKFRSGYLLIILFILPVFLMPSCKTDFDVNADWKDIPVVYGLLDISKDTQDIVLYKVYQNNGKDARDLAKNPDSLYYGDEVSVVVNEYADGNLVNSYNFRKDTLFNKESGLFANPINIVYRAPNMDLKPGNDYVLKISNEKNGNTFTSKAKVIGKTVPVYPNATTELNIGEQKIVQIRWQTGVNTFFYDLSLIFRYKEINLVTGDTSEAKSLEWKLFRLKRTSSNESVLMKYDFISSDFFRFIMGQFKPDPSIRRFTLPAKVIFSAGEEEVYNYIRVNQPSSSIVQKTGEYSNIQDGLGIFSSRNQDIFQINLSAATIDSLKRGQFTKDLGFISK